MRSTFGWKEHKRRRRDVSDVDRLILIPILFAIGYFIYRYVRSTVRGEKGGCHGNCGECSQELTKRIHDDPPVR
ncbi:FeoB-associated Cys-rich membrane protein [Candidatus Poribacteria bacterium]